jgi:hypothetical protein
MKVAIMQPYFMPYIGYFQLIQTVDKYVVYDNIQYTKKGWINRNRILKNGTDTYVTIPLEKNSDYLNICERSVSANFNRKKFLDQITEAYRNAPYFTNTSELIKQAVNNNQNNLFDLIYNSINIICSYLEIKTEMIPSSQIEIDHSLKGKDKVIQICKTLGADIYINAIGGVNLYDKNEFAEHGIDLQFLQTKSAEYEQFHNHFIPNLSIIDVMMFNSKDKIKEMLNGYELI